MKTASILSEAWRNIVTGTSRVPLFAALLAIVGGLAGTAEVAMIHGIHEDARSYLAAGSATQYIRAEDSISAAACESSVTYENVQAAGAMRQRDAIPIDSLVGSGFEAYEVTTGFARILDTSADDLGVWVSDELARSLGVAAGTSLLTGGRELRISAVFDYPADGRDSRLAYAIVVPVARGDGPFDECWMRSWPESPDAESHLRATTIYGADNGIEISITQLNKSLGRSFGGDARFTERLTRWSPPLAAGAGALIGLAWTRRRKLEHAAALHAGQSRTAMSGTAVIEALAWSLLGVTLGGVVIGVGVVAFIPIELHWAASLALSPLLAALGGAVLGTTLGAFLVRESDLFRYFKER